PATRHWMLRGFPVGSLAFRALDALEVPQVPWALEARRAFRVRLPHWALRTLWPPRPPWTRRALLARQVFPAPWTLLTLQAFRALRLLGPYRTLRLPAASGNRCPRRRRLERCLPET